MTWEEAMAAAKVLLEEKVGTAARTEEAAEMAQVAASVQAIREAEGR